MQKIVPHLWFDKQAKQAADFYVSLFPSSRITHSDTLTGTPSGDVDIVAFELSGYTFAAISAGPLFKLNPSISFILNFDPARGQTEEDLNALWERLIEGGKALMPIDSYPFSKRYGWVQDKYGVTWQLMLTNPEGEPRPFVTPSMMFTKEKVGKADEAIEFYTSVFKDSRRGITARYPEGTPDAGTIMFADFEILHQWFAAMDSAGPHEFTFNEAISLMVNCKDQTEIDYYWEKLSAVPESEQCGWLKDKFGVSWQIVPENFDDMLAHAPAERKKNVTQAFLQMKKIDMAKLEEAYNS